MEKSFVDEKSKVLIVFEGRGALPEWPSDMVDEDEKMNSEYYLDLTVIVAKTDNNHNLILDCSTMGNILCLDRIASLNN